MIKIQFRHRCHKNFIYIKRIASRAPGSITLFLAKLCALPVQFLVSMVIWRDVHQHLLNEEIRSISVLMTLTFIPTILLLGGHVTVGNTVIENVDKARVYLLISFVMPLLILLTLFPFLLYYKDLLGRFLLFPEDPFFMITTVILTFLLIAPTAVSQNILIIQKRFMLVTFTPLMGSILSLGFFFLLKSSNFLNIISVYLAFLIGPILTSAVYTVCAIEFMQAKFTKFNIRDLVKYVNPGALIISIGAPLAFQMDRFIVAKFGTIQDSLKMNAINRVLSSVLLIIGLSSTALWHRLRLTTRVIEIRKYILEMIAISSFLSVLILFFLPSVVAFMSSGTIEIGLLDSLSVCFYVLVHSLISIPVTYNSDKIGQFYVFITMFLSAIAAYFLCGKLIQHTHLSVYILSVSLVQIFIIFIPLGIRFLHDVDKKEADTI